MSKEAVLVPDIGGEAADVIEVLVRPGDSVAADQAIVVLESAKASMEVPCPRTGRVAEVAVRVGQQVREGDLLLQLETGAQPAAPGGLPVADIGAELNAVSDLLDRGETAAPPPGATSRPAAAPASSSAPSPAVAQGGAPEQAAVPAPARPPAAEGGGTAPDKAALLLVRVPDIGVEEAEVIEILVREGQAITTEQSLVVLESAKASLAIPSPVSGVVRQVLVKIGEKVFESSQLLEVDVAEGAPVEAPAVTPAIKPGVPVAVFAGLTAGAPPSATMRETTAAAGAAALAPAGISVHAGPAVRRLARELGVDLVRVRGSGPRERILKEDVHAFVKQSMRQLASGATTGSAMTAANLPAIDFAKWGSVERVPLTKIQRVSAQNLHRAWITIPHVTQFDEADITGLEAFRVAHKDAFKAEGLSLTLLSFLVKTVAHVLREFPRFASSLEPDGETLVMKGYVHIGVAVDTPNGLVVPVIRDADRKSVREIARDLGELSTKARERKLMPADMQGACFSISSLGGIGGTAFTPIVNWPEVAILGVSRSAMRPVWNGQEFQARLMLPLSLSYDHRVIDGADAARFTTALARRLADIRELLL